MIDEDLEFSISQYVDGSLSAAEQSALELRFTEDQEARDLLQAYRAIDLSLKAVPLPNVRWDLLASSISTAVDHQHAQTSAVVYRFPAWARVLAPLALAASVMISVVGIRNHLSATHSSVKQEPTGVEVAQSSTLMVVGPQAEQSSAPAEVQVSIAPSNAAKDEPILVHYSSDVVSRPSHVAVASGDVPAHDTATLSYDMQ